MDKIICEDIVLYHLKGETKQRLKNHSTYHKKRYLSCIMTNQSAENAMTV